MTAKILWETGSAIIAIMGLLHLRGTLFTKALFPRNERLKKDMESATLLLTDKLTMWKCWIGFNATHSIGAAFLGITGFYLALKHFEILRSDQWLLLSTLLAAGFYVWVARKYWFKTVLVLLSVAWSCFIASYILMMTMD